MSRIPAVLDNIHATRTMPNPAVIERSAPPLSRRRASALLMAASIVLASCAAPGNEGRAPGTAPDARVRPHLFSLSVANLDRATDWYGEALGFSEGRVVNAPELGLRIHFMELDGFRLELVELRGAGARRNALPDTMNDASLLGPVKVGFQVDDVDAVWRRILRLGATPVVPPRDDAVLGARSALLRDPDGNLVQITGPAMSPARP